MSQFMFPGYFDVHLGVLQYVPLDMFMEHEEVNIHKLQVYDKQENCMLLFKKSKLRSK